MPSPGATIVDLLQADFEAVDNILPAALALPAAPAAAAGQDVKDVTHASGGSPASTHALLDCVLAILECTRTTWLNLSVFYLEL